MSGLKSSPTTRVVCSSNPFLGNHHAKFKVCSEKGQEVGGGWGAAGRRGQGVGGAACNRDYPPTVHPLLLTETPSEPLDSDVVQVFESQACKLLSYLLPW